MKEQRESRDCSHKRLVQQGKDARQEEGDRRERGKDRGRNPGGREEGRTEGNHHRFWSSSSCSLAVSLSPSFSSDLLVKQVPVNLLKSRVDDIRVDGKEDVLVSMIAHHGDTKKGRKGHSRRGEGRGRRRKQRKNETEKEGNLLNSPINGVHVD